MCGIVGVMGTGILSDKALGLFQGLLYLDKVRGDHATGVAKINPWNGMVKTFKKAVGAQKFLGDDEALDFMEKERGRIYIGHNRYATMGDKSKDENAHPFTQDHITLVHNGGVDRWTLEGLEGYDDDDVSVDSHMVCKTIAAHGIEEAVKKLSGAFSLVWWDHNQRTLNFLRNKDRPMWIATLTDGTLFWASEREMMDFFVNRKKNSLSYKDEPREIPLETMISYTFNNNGVLQEGGSPKATKLAFADIPDPKPVVTRTYGTYSSPNVNYSQGSYDRRANALLDWWKIGAHLGDTIVFKVETIKPSNGNAGRVDIEGVFDGQTVRTFWVEKDKVQHTDQAANQVINAKWIEGKITNAYEVKVKMHGVSYDDLIIVLDGTTVKRVVEAPKKRLKVTSVVTAIGPTFPLKCNGHTFTNRDEFVDFVSCGCSLCGRVPTSFDPLNKNMTVYQLDNFAGLLKDCEYVCGQCVQESEPSK